MSLKELSKARASKNLESMKLVELVLRHERDLEGLTPQGLQLLARARRTTLQPPDDHEGIRFQRCQHQKHLLHIYIHIDND